MFDFEFNEPDMLCQDSHRDYTSIIVQPEKHSMPSSCPHCGSKMYRHGRYTRKLKEMPVYPDTTYTLIIKAQRYRCPECGFTLRQEIPNRYPGTNITKRVAVSWIKAFLNAKFPVSQIEDITGIHWDTIRKIQEELISQALNEYEDLRIINGYRPKYLAIDEFAIRKMHKYATCVMDLEKGHVIWAGLGRAKADFEHFFKDIPTDYLEQVEAVAMDMNASYNLLVEQYLPQATIVYDRYHMQAQFGREVIGTTRLEAVKVHRKQADQLIIQAECETQNETREMLEAQAKEEKRIASLLKKSRWTLLKNSKKLKDSEQQKLATILESHKEVAICYAMKEEMIRLYELRNEQQARDGWLIGLGSKSKRYSCPSKVCTVKRKTLTGISRTCDYPNKHR